MVDHYQVHVSFQNIEHQVQEKIPSLLSSI